MSIVTDVRSSADTALEQGMSTRASLQQRLKSLPSDARERSGSIIEDTKAKASTIVGDTKAQARNARELARRQTYASVGASDALLAAITKRTAELPGDAKHTAARLLDTAKKRIHAANELAAQAQDTVVSVVGELKGRGTDVVQAARKRTLTSPARVKDRIEVRVGEVKDAYNKLANRGEQVSADLRHDPVLVRIIGDADLGVEKAANRVTAAAQKLRARAAAQAKRETAAATATPVRPVPANKVPAHKTTVRKTPAGEAPISTIPTHRAAAIEAETRRAAALKAAETRKEMAEAREQAAETRKTAARKAAETRKAAAEEATAKRKAAAAKAAQTRKGKAETRSAAAAKAATTRKINAAAK